MNRRKVKNNTVGFFRQDTEVPFVNLEMFDTVDDAMSIPHYWRDRDGNLSQFWHSGTIPKGTGVMCRRREFGMKHTFWVVTDPESELVGKVFVVGFVFKDRKETSDECFEYSNISPAVKYSVLSEKP